MGWIEDIARPGGSRQLTHSTVDGDGVVRESWRDLLDQARAYAADTTLSEYTLARVIVSERGNAGTVELAAIAAADKRRAEEAGKSIIAHATGGTMRYGQQGGIRPVSTKFDPDVRHLRIARAVLSGAAGDPARGATLYFDPRDQLRMHLAGRRSLHPLVILDAWTYNRAIRNRRFEGGRWVADLGPKRRGGKEWIGPVAGIDPWRTMLLRDVADGDADQDARFAAARRVIESGGKHGGGTRAAGAGDLLVTGAAVALFLLGR